MRYLFPAIAVAGICAFQPSFAQPYPARPVTVVVPVPAGGTGDTIARLIAAQLQERLHQPFVVDNRPGANTTIGATFAARARADGYTLLVTGAPTFTINPLIYPNARYSAASFDYLGIVAAMPMVMLTYPGSPLKTVADVVAAARKEPGGLSYGSFGSGSMPNIIAESFALKTGITLLHVPFQGSAPSLTALMGKQTALAVDSVVAAAPFIQSGALVPIAVASRQHAALLPQVPTFIEQGVPDFVFDNWVGVVAPKGLPADVSARLEAELKAVVQAPEVQKKLGALGFSASWQDGAAFQRRASAEMAQNATVVEKAKLK
ncbi:tripartite tricarboxylate transporter substrate binding protein [Cupriavidus sp. WS]|uniref:Bug family tripartite tricarboxylate transporter substrate binding protein n=1 Tax=Cupriavidus sp. WS TaxID=1312922 RepID=UPI00036933EA|nr:tripartite tricarboxylate transporter substrate binding protein [Cupriavidus sp. WS]